MSFFKPETMQLVILIKPSLTDKESTHAYSWSISTLLAAIAIKEGALRHLTDNGNILLIGEVLPVDIVIEMEINGLLHIYNFG